MDLIAQNIAWKIYNALYPSLFNPSSLKTIYWIIQKLFSPTEFKTEHVFFLPQNPALNFILHCINCTIFTQKCMPLPIPSQKFFSTSTDGSKKNSLVGHSVLYVLRDGSRAFYSEKFLDYSSVLQAKSLAINYALQDLATKIFSKRVFIYSDSQAALFILISSTRTTPSHPKMADSCPILTAICS